MEFKKMKSLFSPYKLFYANNYKKIQPIEIAVILPKYVDALPPRHPIYIGKIIEFPIG